MKNFKTLLAITWFTPFFALLFYIPIYYICMTYILDVRASSGNSLGTGMLVTFVSYWLIIAYANVTNYGRNKFMVRLTLFIWGKDKTGFCKAQMMNGALALSFIPAFIYITLPISKLLNVFGIASIPWDSQVNPDLLFIVIALGIHWLVGAIISLLLMRYVWPLNTQKITLWGHVKK